MYVIDVVRPDGYTEELDPGSVATAQIHLNNYLQYLSANAGDDQEVTINIYHSGGEWARQGGLARQQRLTVAHGLVASKYRDFSKIVANMLSGL